MSPEAIMSPGPAPRIRDASPGLLDRNLATARSLR